MKYNFELNCLFEKWIAESMKNNEWPSNEQIAFTKDGLLEKNDLLDVEALWHSSRKRVLFLLKDQPSDSSDDVRLWLKDSSEDNPMSLRRKRKNRELNSRFMRNIANVFWGLYNINKPEDCDYFRALESFEDVKRCFNTAPVAFMEAKKQGGAPSISNTTLKCYLEKYKIFLWKELDILSPNIIVCTSSLIYTFVIDYYNKKYIDSPLCALSGAPSIRIHPKTQSLIFCSYHPSARPSVIDYATFYGGVMNHYRAFLCSEYFFQFKSIFT